MASDVSEFSMAVTNRIKKKKKKLEWNIQFAFYTMHYYKKIRIPSFWNYKSKEEIYSVGYFHDIFYAG